MRSHVIVGHELVTHASEDFVPIASTILAPHERWDGAGYPLGLGGRDIPLEGRILAVADVFEALTCPRPYRPALQAAEALAYLEGNRGSQFDPDLVAPFAELVAASAITMAPSPHQLAAAGWT